MTIVVDVQLRPLEEEEEQDYEALKLLMEEKKRLFRYLFNSYANSMANKKLNTSIDTPQLKGDTISLTELSRMFTEHNVPMKKLSHLEVSRKNDGVVGGDDETGEYEGEWTERCDSTGV
jgi:hypothetical protein